MPELHPALVLLGGAALLPLVPVRARTAWFLAVPVLAGLAVLGLDDGTTTSVGWYGFELTPMRVDGLSLAFAYVFALIAILGSVYGLRITGTVERAAALAYGGCAFGVVFAGDLLTLFVFWELKAFTSVFLIWARRRTESDRAGMRFLYVNVAGGLVLLGGILWHLASTGSLAFDAFELNGATTLILVGFLLAAAVPPLHAWLPDAYPAATVAGTVFLSAFTTKAAVYALARGFPGTTILVWLGVVMALYGVVYAVLENDIRRLLAYHIVSQVGFMVAAVGIGTDIAINGAAAHAFAHVLYKGLLLMGAGAVLYATGRSRLTELGGLARAMPVVLVLYMVGAFSISGVPLFSGFVSKEVVVFAADVAAWDSVVWLLKLASVGTFLHTGLKLPWFTWFGRARTDMGRLRPLPPSMYVGMALTAALSVAIGLAPGVFYRVLPHALDYRPYTLAHVTEVIQLLAFTAFGFWLLRSRLAGEPTLSTDTDWFYRVLPLRLWSATERLRELQVPQWARPAPALARVRARVTGAADPAEAVPDARLQPTWLLGVGVLATFVVILALSVLP